MVRKSLVKEEVVVAFSFVVFLNDVALLFVGGGAFCLASCCSSRSFVRLRDMSL